jgi:hypothetical protein
MFLNYVFYYVLYCILLLLSFVLWDRYDKILWPSFFLKKKMKKNLGKNWPGSKLLFYLLLKKEWRSEDLIVSIPQYSPRYEILLSWYVNSTLESFYHVIRNFFRRDLSASSGERERNFCDGIFLIPRQSQIFTRQGPRLREILLATGTDPPTNESSVANLTIRLLFQNSSWVVTRSDLDLFGRRIGPRCEYHFSQRGPWRVQIWDCRGIRKIPSQKFHSRSPDDADKSRRKKFLITW